MAAASTRGRTIRLQPSDVLRDAGTLGATLQHELLHMLVEEHAKAGTPLWFREGLVLYLAQPDGMTARPAPAKNARELDNALRAPHSKREMRRGWAEAQARVGKMAHEHGKQTLLEWLQDGLPAE